MNYEYVLKANEKITDKNVLINLAAKRAAQLSTGERPLIGLPRDTEGKALQLSNIDIALLEIAEGAITFERIKD